MFCLIFIYAYFEGPPKCVTTGGPSAGQPCVFPFIFAGVSHDVCDDWTWGGQPPGTTWCSTKVDANGVHVTGNYGFCPSTCITLAIAPPCSGCEVSRNSVWGPMVTCTSGHYVDGFRVGYDSTMRVFYTDSYVSATQLRCSDNR